MTTPAQNINTAYAGVSTRKTYNSSGVLTTTVDVVVTKAREVRFRLESNNNPLRPDGTRAPSSWNSYGGFVRAGEGRFFNKGSGLGHTDTEGVFYRLPTQLGPAIPVAMSDADVRVCALREALGHYGEADAKLGVTLRETKDTSKALQHYYQGAYKGAGRLLDLVQRKKGFGKHLSKALKDTSKKWKDLPSEYLGYLYGIAPLAGEVENAVDVLTATKEREGQFKMYLHGNHRGGSTECRLVSGVSSGGSYRLWGSSEYHGRASLCFQLPSWFWDRLPPVTPFREAWETTRLSFVLDWALPVKSWLKGFEGTQLRPFFTEGSVTVFKRFAYQSVELYGESSGSYVSGGSPSGFEYFMQRVKLSTFPTEDLLLRPPRFRSVLQLDKLDDAAALLGQRLAKLSQALK